MSKIHLFLLTWVLALTACGGGGGSSDDGDLNTTVGVPLSNYVVVNLSSGKITAYKKLNDITTNNKYKTTHMVFRTLKKDNSTYYGQAPGTFGRQADETEGAGSVSKYFIGVFEVTQAQWERIDGSTPWTTIDSTALGLPDWTVAVDEKPASNLSYNSITSALSSYNSGRSYSLALPSDIQWEHACRANGLDLFSWGADTNTTVAGQYAVVRETFGGTDGPEVVGQQTPNAFGLYDCHGNVWEMTTGHFLRGGSWYDNITQARSANKHDVLDDVEHFLVGVRLVFKP